MDVTTAVTERMKIFVITSAQTISLNVVIMVDVYLVLTNVTGIKIVLMDLMNLTKFAVSTFAMLLYINYFLIDVFGTEFIIHRK